MHSNTSRESPKHNLLWFTHNIPCATVFSIFVPNYCLIRSKFRQHLLHPVIYNINQMKSLNIYSIIINYIQCCCQAACCNMWLIIITVHYWICICDDKTISYDAINTRISVNTLTILSTALFSAHNPHLSLFPVPLGENSNPFFCKILSCHFSAFRIHVTYARCHTFVFCKCLSWQINTCIYCFGIAVSDAGNHIPYTGNNNLASYRYFFYVSVVIFSIATSFSVLDHIPSVSSAKHRPTASFSI